MDDVYLWFGHIHVQGRWSISWLAGIDIRMYSNSIRQRNTATYYSTRRLWLILYMVWIGFTSKYTTPTQLTKISPLSAWTQRVDYVWIYWYYYCVILGRKKITLKIVKKSYLKIETSNWNLIKVKEIKLNNIQIYTTTYLDSILLGKNFEVKFFNSTLNLKFNSVINSWFLQEPNRQ